MTAKSTWAPKTFTAARTTQGGSPFTELNAFQSGVFMKHIL